MKLEKLSSYVLTQINTSSPASVKVENIERYAKFLTQPVTKGLFMPVDEDGKPLAKPKEYREWQLGGNMASARNLSCIEYRKAAIKTLFEGDWYQSKVNRYTTIKMYKCKTVEDLIPYDLTLTDTAYEIIHAL